MNSIFVIRRKGELEPGKLEKLPQLVELVRAAVIEGFTGRISFEMKDGVPVSAEVVRNIKL